MFKKYLLNEWSVKKGKKKIVFNRLSELAAKSKNYETLQTDGGGECDTDVTGPTAAFKILFLIR